MGGWGSVEEVLSEGGGAFGEGELSGGWGKESSRARGNP